MVADVLLLVVVVVVVVVLAVTTPRASEARRSTNPATVAMAVATVSTMRTAVPDSAPRPGLNSAADVRGWRSIEALVTSEGCAIKLRKVHSIYKKEGILFVIHST